MKDFKITNLRELSTEEQMFLNGGENSTGCSCSVTCTCEGDTPKATADKTAKDVGDALKKRLE